MRKAPESSGAFLSLFQNILEVVRHTDGRHGDDLPAIRLEVRQAEVRGLGHETAILYAHIPAGAQLVGKSAPKQRTRIGALTRIEVRRPIIADRGKDQASNSALNERIEVTEVQRIDVRCRNLLLAGMDAHIWKKAGVELGVVLCEGVVQLK